MDDQIYNYNPLHIPDISGEVPPSKEKTCPGLQRFCPHYTSGVCDVKYSECVLLNSLKCSETILRAEREQLLRDPTPKNLTLVTQINDVLQDQSLDMQIDPKTIVWNRRKGRFVAVLFFLVIAAAAALIYAG